MGQAVSEEVFDVVDESDKPTGKLTTKKESHIEGLPHRVVAVLVFQKGKLLLQVHESSDGIFDHTVGGHVTASESYPDAAFREMKEEINLDSPVEQIKLSIFSDEVWKGDKVTHMFGLFKTEAPESWVFEPNEEVKSLVPMTIEQILSAMEKDPLNFTGGFMATLTAYLESENKPTNIVRSAAKTKGVTI